MVIDIIFIIVAGFGFYMGFSRGIIQTVFTIISYIFGLIAAFKLTPAATNFLETAFGSEHPMMFAAGFLLVLFGTIMLWRLISRFFVGALESANINILNQAAGGALLAAIFILIYSTLIWFGVQSHIVKDEAMEESMTYPLLKEYPTATWAVLKKIKPSLLEFWDHSVEAMDKIEKISIEQTEEESNIYDVPDKESTSSRR